MYEHVHTFPWGEVGEFGEHSPLFYGERNLNVPNIRHFSMGHPDEERL